MRSPFHEPDYGSSPDPWVGSEGVDEEAGTTPTVDVAPASLGSPGEKPGIKLTLSKALTGVNKWMLGARANRGRSQEAVLSQSQDLAPPGAPLAGG